MIKDYHECNCYSCEHHRGYTLDEIRMHGNENFGLGFAIGVISTIVVSFIVFWFIRV